jgi:hypothetical protein
MFNILFRTQILLTAAPYANHIRSTRGSKCFLNMGNEDCNPYEKKSVNICGIRGICVQKRNP